MLNSSFITATNAYFELVKGQRFLEGSVVGLRIVRTVDAWEFPKDPFIEFEPQDEEWCRPLNIGKMVKRENIIHVPNARISLVSQDKVEFTSGP